MRKIEKIRDHLIIQISDTYTYRDRDYKVLTAAAEIIDGQADMIQMTEPIYHLKDIKTGKLKFVPESVLEAELPKYNEVVQLAEG